MKERISRRSLLTLSAAAAAGVAAGSSIPGEQQQSRPNGPVFAKDRQAIPSACWQCVSRCPIIGIVEKGELLKIEGNPASQFTRGRLCAKGQAGINQIDNPDRLLHPIVRTGARGEGKWKQIDWDEALDLLIEGGTIAGQRVNGLRSLRDEGTPEKFLFHYGRAVGSDWAILMSYFLPAYGTASVGDHNSICMLAGGIASYLTGGPETFLDFDKVEMILNFGNSLFEAGVDHVPLVQRCVGAVARGAKMVTFDPRLSNTAARSSEWVPLKPATDLAVLLAMCHEIVSKGLHDEQVFAEHTNVSIEEIEKHLEPFTPEWAANLSGVPAGRIRTIAREYATTKPGICISGRGAFMHHNGVQTQRAVYMLQALTGNLLPEGRGWARPRWDYPFPFPERAKKRLDIFSGGEGQYSHPIGGVSHQILERIKEGPDRPELYMVYCHNPVYANGDCDANAQVLSDTNLVPFLVAVDVTLSETSMLADLVLPDATYLERWTCDGRTSPEGVAEYQIRQPMHSPRGEARNFIDVACGIAERLGIDLGFGSAEEFVSAACESTGVVRKAGGLEYMKHNGVLCDLDAAVPRRPPDKMKLRSEELERAGIDALPSWMPVPGHEELSEGLVLITYKVAVHSHSRTQGSKWLSELYHDNRAWIHPATASARGLRDGDRVTIRSEVGEIVTRVRVTEGVHPEAIAISHHCGHWGHGVYASGVKGPFHGVDEDEPLKWWSEHGTHVNRIIPNRGDPIAGSMCWNDTIVTIAKA